MGFRVLLTSRPTRRGGPPRAGRGVTPRPPTCARSRREFAEVRRGGRPALLGRLPGPPEGRVVLDLERAQPHAVPEAARARRRASTARWWRRRCRAIRANARRAREVLVGETAPVGTPGTSIGPREFMRAGCASTTASSAVAGAAAPRFKRLDVDGCAHHPYGPADARTAQEATSSTCSRSGAWAATSTARRARRPPPAAPARSTTPSSGSRAIRPTRPSAPRSRAGARS